MRVPVALAVAAALAPLAAYAASAEPSATAPKPIDHMQSVEASPLKRIRLTGVIGRVVNITFNPKEAIYRVVFGTAGFWEGPQAGSNGQAVALKKTSRSGPSSPAAPTSSSPRSTPMGTNMLTSST